MFLELRKIDFVIGVGGRMVIHEIICFFLLGNKCGDTLEHEIEVVSSPFHLRGELGGVELGQRRHQTLRGSQQIFSSTQGEARGFACARVEDDYAGGLVEFWAVRLCVGSRTYHAPLFSGEENEKNVV